MMNKSYLFGLALVVMAMSSSHAITFDLGATYTILEPNPTDDIKAAASKVNWQELYEKKTKMSLPLASLSRATRDKTFFHTVTNTIEMDVINPKTGEILYPKGYEFNPLNHMRLPRFIVISNSEQDIRWLNKQTLDANTMILTISDPFELMHKLRKKIMILKPDLKERLKLEHYPAIVEQIKNQIQVREFHVPN